MSTLFLLFGATGDLAKRYLLPSLANIRDKRDDIDVIAVGRRPYSSGDFREFIMREGATFFSDSDRMVTFLESVTYHQVELDDASHYERLAEALRERSGPDTEIVIYLSIATEHFPLFLTHIAPHRPTLPKMRVVFEKPFGSDLTSARSLQEAIEGVFSEDEVYRIDHYVAKNAIENLLAFRFSNTLFSPVWNREYIDNIQITASESLGIGERGAFYEGAGALRDMVQNHLFQTLAMVIMRRPESLDPEAIRKVKTEALRSYVLAPDLEEQVVFGQYEGYTEEKNVSADSRTETFVALELASDLEEWRGVPLYIRTGKRLDRKITQIVIEFQLPENIGFRNIEPNRIIIEVQPDESLEITFSKKSDQDEHSLEQVVSKSQSSDHGKGAYEKLLEDVIDGDPTLFTTWEMLESTWHTIDPIIHCRESCPILHIYPPGSRGPVAMCSLLERSGRNWYE